MTRNTFMQTAVLSACLLLACLLSAVPAADEGLVNHWSFDNDSAGVVKNSVNEQFNAKLSQDFPRVDGIHGKAVDLSGNYQIEIPANFVPSRLKELTFSAWIAPRSLGGYANIIRKDDVNGPVTNRLLFALQENGRFLSLGLTTGGNYAECDGIIAPEELLDGQWHFVAGTFDGKTMRVYLDGKEVGSYERQSSQIDTSADFRPLKKYWSNEYNLHTNRNLDELTVNVPGFIGSSSGKGEFFDGKLDDLRFYSRALSLGEIQAEFAKVRSAQTLTDKFPEAQKLYRKSETFSNIYQPDGNYRKEPKSQAYQFQDTLTFTSTNVFNFLNNGVRTDLKDCNGNPIPPKYASWDEAKAALMPNALLVQLHRLIRNDFPAETNDYLVRFGMSPVEIMTWSKDAQKKRINELRDAFTEYMPLTENQRQYLPKKDAGKWWLAKGTLEGLDKGAAFNLYEVLFIMMREIHARPQMSERVAPYRKPETPVVKDRSPDEAQKIFETDWLFQCDGKPTAERSLQEIGWARALAARIQKQYSGKVNFDAELKQLDELETKAKSANGEDAGLYFAVRKVKREITFKNPVLNFDSIVYVDGPMPEGNENRHETRHRLGYMAVPGARLMTLKGLHPGGHQTKLMPQEPLHGSFWRPDLSYDAQRVLVGFKPHNEKNFHIYEVGVDGSMERQLTAGMFDDFDPIYLPDGKNMMFLTTRGHIYVRCMPPTNAFVLARMSLDTKAGDKNLYIVSRNGEPEYTPSVMNDGRVIYTRWEYTDKPLWRAQSLWTMNSDGTQVQTFWGNQSVWPDLLKDARSIPGSERVMFTGAGHHNWFGGSIGIIDPGKGFNFPDGLTKVTQELAWVESGNGSVDPKESPAYHTAGKYSAYYSPYPLSEKDILVSAERPVFGNDGKPISSKWVLELLDTDGNRELVFEGDKHIFDAQPIRPRLVPQIAADRVDWPNWDNRDKPATGT
ncbi:MAG: hypothetical protein LBT46_14730, partial [Planctomycetaceae bacterium]|nr:hypothetical protein [Planctomycetaceae bacterium]